MTSPIRAALRRTLSSRAAQLAFDQLTDAEINELRQALAAGGDTPRDLVVDDQEQPEPEAQPNDLDAIVAGLKRGDSRLWDFYRSKLSPEDFAQLRSLVLAEPGMNMPATDNPLDFPGKPLVGGGQVPLAQDAARSQSLVKNFGAATALNIAKVRLADTIGEQDRRPTRAQRVNFASGGDAAAEASFERRFPGAAKIRHV